MFFLNHKFIDIDPYKSVLQICITNLYYKSVNYFHPSYLVVAAQCDFKMTVIFEDRSEEGMFIDHPS